MNLNIDNWAEFRVGDLFDIHPTKFVDGLSANDCVGHGYPLVVNSAENNGVAGLCDIEPTEDGDIITFSDTTDGNTFFYQPNPFIGFAHVQGMYPKNPNINKNIMLFISTMLMFDSKGRYSYGRKMRRDTISEVMLKLPTDINGNPDWQFMEDYIKSLHYEPLTTKNRQGQAPDLDVQNWREFKIKDLFDMQRGSITSMNEIDDGKIPIVSASGENEGIAFYGNVPALYNNNITISMNGVNTGFTAYHGYPFNINVDCCVLIQKFDMNVYIGEFIATIIGRLRYKYSYGRKMSAERIMSESIMLPVDVNGNPDWQFMENYIKALPYGDRL